MAPQTHRFPSGWLISRPTTLSGDQPHQLLTFMITREFMSFSKGLESPDATAEEGWRELDVDSIRMQMHQQG